MGRTYHGHGRTLPSSYLSAAATQLETQAEMNGSERDSSLPITSDDNYQLHTRTQRHLTLLTGHLLAPAR